MVLTLPDSARRVLASDEVATIATIDPDGRLHLTCAWVGLDGDEIVIGTLVDQRKLQNIRRDPRVTLSLQTPTINAHGLKEYLVVYGHARVTEGGGAELLQELAITYLGPDVKFPPMDDPPPGWVTHITPERIRGVGPWVSGAAR